MPPMTLGILPMELQTKKYFFYKLFLVMVFDDITQS